MRYRFWSLAYLIVGGLCLCAGLGAAHGAGDWPTWRYDVNRSAASAMGLPGELHLQWQRELPTPKPAFVHDPRMCVDTSYEPVVMGDRIFVPSMVADTVTAFEVETGAEEWKFFADGPVRFAPVAWEGRLYFVSDDGHLYCLDVNTGALRWKFRGAPRDRDDHWLLGNERLISRWPARGGPVLQDGAIYFGAGVWPLEGVYVYALDAATGRVRWVNGDIARIEQGFNDHGKQWDVGLPPLGYLSIIGGKLAVTSGRALPVFLDLQTGKADPYTPAYGKFQPYPKGHWYVTSIGDYFFQGGYTYGVGPEAAAGGPPEWMTLDEYAQFANIPPARVRQLLNAGWLQTKEEDGQTLLSTELPPGVTPIGFGHRNVTENERLFMESHPKLNVDPVNRIGREIGAFREAVLTEEAIYFSELADPARGKRERGELGAEIDQYDRIVAQDISRRRWSGATSGPTTYPPKNDRQKLILWKFMEFEEQWRLDSPLKVYLKAGDRLYAGGPDAVAAVSIPKRGEEGKLYCFGGEQVAPTEYALQEETLASAPDEWTERVRELVDDGASTEGYCLVLGWGTGRLVEELARQTDLHIIVIEPDGQIVDANRRALDAAGLYGGRVHIVQGDLAAVRLPAYMADLIASEDRAAVQSLRGGTPAEDILSLLRPYSGIALLPLRDEQHASLVADTQAHADFAVRRDGGLTVVRRTSAPEGSDDWTHEAGSAGNTFATKDTRVTPPFGLLWFAGSVDRMFAPAWDYTHNRNPYGVVLGGRMFMLVGSKVHAMDIYTGRHLWQTELAQSAKTERWAEYHRNYSRPTDNNIVAADDGVYVFDEAACVRLDPASGERMGEIEIPAQTEGAAWDEVRLWGDSLLAAIGSRLVCMSIRGGQRSRVLRGLLAPAAPAKGRRGCWDDRDLGGACLRWAGAVAEGRERQGPRDGQSGEGGAAGEFDDHGQARALVQRRPRHRRHLSEPSHHESVRGRGWQAAVELHGPGRRNPVRAGAADSAQRCAHHRPGGHHRPAHRRAASRCSVEYGQAGLRPRRGQRPHRDLPRRPRVHLRSGDKAADAPSVHPVWLHERHAARRWNPQRAELRPWLQLQLAPVHVLRDGAHACGRGVGAAPILTRR